MAATAQFRKFIEDHLSDLGAVTTRPMFGGAGVYLGGTMFALIADDTLYIKADAINQADFIRAGASAFVYQGKGRPVTMSYWRAPDVLLEDREEMAVWARAGLMAAARAKR